MSLYPQPSFNNTVSMVKYANVVTGNYMTILWTMAMAILFFILLKRKDYRTSDSLLAAFFLTMVMSAFLWAAGLLAGKFIVLYLVLTIISAIYSAFD